jgi:hypothetical protein
MDAQAGTVKFYPLRSNWKLYGAVISGEHYFYHTNKGQPKCWREGRDSRTPCD